jgi:hypothetical protein
MLRFENASPFMAGMTGYIEIVCVCSRVHVCARRGLQVLGIAGEKV